MPVPVDHVAVATGMLAERHHLGVQAAYDRLFALAVSADRDLDEFAASLVSSTRELVARPATGAEPAMVRRAVEFIHANAHLVIGVQEIANAAGLGSRGLQFAFRKHRSETPLACLRAVRMERAHDDLVAGDTTTGDTVAAIAARWGYDHGGRFASRYRIAYGCTPSTTLRR